MLVPNALCGNTTLLIPFVHRVCVFVSLHEAKAVWRRPNCVFFSCVIVG